MPLYATANDLREWTGKDSAALSDTDADRVLVLAERDIDGLAPLGPEINVETGRRYDPTTLSEREALVLKRVTCSQAEYRLAMGEEFFLRGQYDKVTGPDFTTEGKLPRIAPGAWNELAGTGFIRLSTTTGVRYWTRGRQTQPDFPVRDPRTEFEQG